jgi:H+/Cl- antiporter ClcA
MRKPQMLLAIILVGICAALTYHVFENVVHAGINLIWIDWFNTDSHRILVIPLSLCLTLLFCGSQHLLDKESEHNQEYGLGNMPVPTIANYLKVLLLGFLSLIAGASLGPEAVLVPACMILGAYAGAKTVGDKPAAKLLTAAAITALFTGFFHSLLVGVLSVVLVAQQAKVKLSVSLVLVAVIASTASYLTLLLVGGESYIALPEHSWALNFRTVLIGICLVAGGYLTIYCLHFINVFAKGARTILNKNGWVVNAAIASLIISALYLLGGPLIEFTGNNSIIPLFNQAGALGLWGLLGVLVTKIAAMAWSKGIGYRGGMIFPTIFLASVMVAIAQLYVHEFNLIYGLIAVLTGAFVANHKTHILM